MNIAEATFVLGIFNSIAVPLLLAAVKWRKRVDRRLARIEQHLELDPFASH